MWSLKTDRIVCINLLERNDRLETAKAQFAAVGLRVTSDNNNNNDDNDDETTTKQQQEHEQQNAVSFHRVSRHPRGGKYGCYDSHRAVIQQAYDDGLDTVLIFEDDVQFKPGWEEVIRDAHAFVQSGIVFDALFLGCEILYVDEKTWPTLWRIKCIHAHAYVVSRQGMVAFLAHAAQFERDIHAWPQDVIQNSAWRHMYGHASSRCITQDAALGTDNHWIRDIPAAYVEWFQTVILPQYHDLIRPLVRSDAWRASWMGRRYVFSMDQCDIRDGRVRLHGLWFVDVVMVLVLALLTKPPHGYRHLLRAMYKRIGPALRSRFALSATRKTSAKKD